MGTLQRTTGPAGLLLMFGGGTLMNECCCGGTTPTPCATVTCPGGDPSMVISVSGSSGTINWCGQTWNLPGDSGVQKCVCPTAYQLLQTGAVRGHNWSFNVSLVMLRQYTYSYFSPGTIQWVNYLIFSDGARVVDKFTYFGFTNTSQIGLLSSLSPAAPTKSDVIITNAWFGSYTTGGITYTWARGQGWP